MRQLRLVALSDDGAHLILSDGGDERLVLQVDERLHAAIRGDRARLGQLEIQLESQLRPRDIQARIRSGESVESVAAISGMPLDKVERFAGPVLAERQHIADRARQATVRRLQGEGKPPTLDVAASESAKAHGIDPAIIEWDAWRRDDGRWIVRCGWLVENDEVFATFSFEPTGRSVVPEDDAARLLAGEMVPEAMNPPAVSTPPAAARVEQVTTPADPEPELYGSPAGVGGDPDETMPDMPAGPARLSVVQGARDVNESDHPAVDERPAAAGDDVRRSSRRPTPYGRSDRRRRHTETWDRDAPPADDEVTSERLRLSDIASNVQVEGPTTAEMDAVRDDPAAAATALPAEPDAAVDDPDLATETTDKPAKKSAKRKNKRPSVPSWDEIMFGRGKPD